MSPLRGVEVEFFQLLQNVGFEKFESWRRLAALYTFAILILLCEVARELRSIRLLLFSID